MGGIIDAEKLQNEQFIKHDYIIYDGLNRMMVCFNVYEKDVKKSVAHYNRLGKLTGRIYTYKKCIIEGLKVLD